MNPTIIEATVPSGFEKSSLDEITEKIPGITDPSHTRGHVRFTLPSDLPKKSSIELVTTHIKILNILNITSFCYS